MDDVRTVSCDHLRPAGLLIALLFSRVLSGQELPVVPPPYPERKELTETEVRAIATVFGVRIGALNDNGDVFTIEANGFSDSRVCPLEGCKDVRCGKFNYRPSLIVIPRKSYIAAVAGHLSRNRVIPVQMTSYDAPAGSSSLHGLLVFPSHDPKGRPAFAWYLSRSGRGIAVEFEDIDADGVLEVLYTYEDELALGIVIVPRDIWTFKDMTASKLVSAGERLPGLLLSTFDGVPIMENGDGWTRRGTYRLIKLGTGKPSLILFERASFPASKKGFEVHVIGDVGDGWRELISGAGPYDPQKNEENTIADCSLGFLPGDLSVQTRRTLLDLEEACRTALEAFSVKTNVFKKMLLAQSLRRAGLIIVAAALEEAVSTELADLWPVSWPISFVLSARAAITARCAYEAVYDISLAKPPTSWLDDIALFPVLWPVTKPLQGILDILEKVKRRLLKQPDEARE